MTRETFFAIAISIATLSSLPAQLQWETDKHEGEIEKGQEEASYTFPFTNTGDYPVTVTDTKSSCGCVVPALAKKIYEPGESGEITATFKIGDRTGEQKKEIRVLTDDPKSNRRLTIHATIPEFATISPSFVHWTPAERDTPKTVTITHNNTPAQETPPYTLTATDPAGHLELRVEPIFEDNPTNKKDQANNNDNANADQEQITENTPNAHWLLIATPNPDKTFQTTRVKGKIQLKFTKAISQKANDTPTTDHPPARPHTDQILYLMHLPARNHAQKE